MSATVIPAKKRTGRPRSQRTEKAILAAASRVLAESGLGGMTIEGVAELARVGKASIYRRWPSRGALAFDASAGDYMSGQPARDTGTLEGDLLATARDWIRTVKRSPWDRTLRGLIAEVQHDPSLASAWRERFVNQVRGQRRPVVERAIARGEIPARSDPDLILDMLYGPLYHRYLQGHLPLTHSFAKGIARMVAVAARAGSAAER
jgi:AcrR family transcriptional regulator